MKKLEINKSDLENNLNIIKNIDNKIEIIAVVKANGMGLGLIEYSKILIENGIEILAVANVYEAIALRKAEIKKEILMLTPCIEKKDLQLLIEHDITLTIGSLEECNLIKEILEASTKKEVKVHIKIDTGFGRYGFLYNDTETILDIFNMENNIKILGIYTHFSKPENQKWTSIQYNRFRETIEKINENGFNTGILHCCASTAFLKYPKMRLDAVRIGSAIQGRTLTKQEGLVKIGNFKSNIIEIKTLPKGYNISYGNTYKTKKETKIAVIPVGYVDGLNKNRLRDDFSLKNNIIAVGMEFKKIFKNNSLKVKINGNYYKIIGRLGMYHSIIDITNSNNININDEVELEIAPLQINDIIRREYI